MTKDEAMKLALEALNQATGMCAERTSTRKDIDEAMAALRQALEQPKYEFELQNYVLCDRCNQIVNKEFERLQQEQFFYKQTQNVPSASNGEDRNE